MKTVQFIFPLMAFFSSFAVATDTTPTAPTAIEEKAVKAPENPKVLMSTNLGDMVIELDPVNAPTTVANFLSYVKSGFYEGVIFHRIIPGFMVQGGGFNAQYQAKATMAPIVNESQNGLRNVRGTISMARLPSPDSASSQFFINLNDNPSLDWKPGNPGYAVFGKLVKGIEVIDKMAEIPQGNFTGVFVNAPNEPVIINKVTLQKTPQK